MLKIVFFPLLLTSFVMGTCLGCSAASNPTNSSHEIILFHSDREGKNNLYIIETDGSSLKRLPDSTHSGLRICETDPTILQLSMNDGYDNLYTLNQDGQLACLTDKTVGGKVANCSPLSPDKMKLVFTDKKDQLWLMNVDGSNKVSISPPGYSSGGEIFWSPNGRYIAVFNDDGKIYVIDSSNTNTSLLTTGDCPCSDFTLGSTPWSPDNKNIIFKNIKRIPQPKAYEEYLGVQSINVETRQSAKIAGDDYTFTRWLDNGHIALVKDHSIYIVDDNGLNLTTVFQMEKANQELNWSPDSTNCAIRCYDESYDANNRRLYKAKIQFVIFDSAWRLIYSGNSAEEDLGDEMYWAPDSSKFIYMSILGDKGFVNCFGVSDRHISTVQIGMYSKFSSFTSIVLAPWNRDSSLFTFAADDIFVYNTNTNTIKNVTNSASWNCCPAFIENIAVDSTSSPSSSPSSAPIQSPSSQIGVTSSASENKNETGTSVNSVSQTTNVPVSAAASLANTPWPMSRHDLTHTGRSPYVGPQTNTVKWAYNIDTPVTSSPTIGSDGTIYVGSRDHKLYAINPNGTMKWSFATDDEVERSSPAIGGDGTIYVGSMDNKLYAINPDGTLKWFYTTGDHIISSPAVGKDGTIYVGSRDHKLYAINPDGTMKWSYATGFWVWSSPAIGSDGTVYVGSEDKKIYAINPDGTFKWSYATGNGVYSSPSIGNDGTIYVGSEDDKLYSINPDGTFKWSYATFGTVESPAIGSDGTVYVSSEDGKLYAINRNGTLRWSYKTGGSIYYSSPAIGNDGTLYFGSGDNKLYAVNFNGTLKWSYDTGVWIGSSPTIGSDGTLYVGSVDGKLYAFNEPAPIGSK